jgi:hypothetical protein
MLAIAAHIRHATLVFEEIGTDTRDRPWTIISSMHSASSEES